MVVAARRGAGSGSRRGKLILPGELRALLPGAEVIEGLAR